MNDSVQIHCKVAFIFLWLMGIGAQAQQRTKTYSENYNIAEDAVLDINTTHTDIKFETWEKNEVSIEAVIEIEGATAEEAEEYFNNGSIDIKGNSRKIEITTGANNTRFFRQPRGRGGNAHMDLDGFNDLLVNIPELSEITEIAKVIEMGRLVEVPPMPPFPMQGFDYEAYKKDGDKYMKEWKKEFDKGFDDDYRKRMEKWLASMVQRGEKRKKLLKERKKERKGHTKERKERFKKKAEEMKEIRKNAHESLIDIMETIEEIDFDHPGKRHNVFFSSSQGKAKNYKVKKTVIIKLPKSVKINMNVRHGEVKLAQNTKDIKAILSYATLVAATIDGDDTVISASYSPVTVQHWNYGQLKTDYSNAVNLEEVGDLRMSANSSNITIGRLNSSINVRNNFGPLVIKSVSDNFKHIDVSLENAALECKIPATAFQVYINGTEPELVGVKGIKLVKTQNLNSTLYKGYHLNKANDKAINITSKYSEVVLKE